MDALSLKDVQLPNAKWSVYYEEIHVKSLTWDILLTDVKLFGFMKKISFCNV